jgi:formate-dependent phosphoribosylglycinamide formyltransferase (GAR transformylase)
MSLQEKFPERMCRLTTYIKGPSFTVNVAISAEKIMMANISYQITGLNPFTDNEFSTIGNDWSLTNKILSKDQLDSIQSIVRDIGSKLKSEGWLGLFGVDFIMDERDKRIYLIEINARQPASTTFESYLQDKARKSGSKGITTFEAHLMSLLGIPINEDIIAISEGAQIVQRVTKNTQSIFDEASSALQNKGYESVTYQNTEINSDLLRVQSSKVIMSNHSILNENGLEIAEIIKNSKLNIQV